MTVRYVYKAPLHLDAMALEMPVLPAAHPNRAIFSGVLTQVDVPSTRPPSGSDGHRILVPRAVAEAALPSLLGMAVGVASTWRDHDARRKIGVFTGGEVIGTDLRVQGFLYAKDFPREVAHIRARRHVLGMSFEISEVDVEDPNAEVWVLRHFVFTGAAILERASAAYEQTSIAARKERRHMGKKTSGASSLLAELAQLEERIALMQARMDEDMMDDEDEMDSESEVDAEEEAGADVSAQTVLKRITQMLDTGRPRKAMRRVDAHQGGELAAMRRLLEKYEQNMAAQSLVKPVAKATEQLQKDVGEIKAGMEMLTDAVTAMRTLLTDTQASLQGLLTDVKQVKAESATEAPPVRKTLAATGVERWVGKGIVEDGKKYTPDELDAVLSRHVNDPQQRIAIKHELAANGQLVQ